MDFISGKDYKCGVLITWSRKMSNFLNVPEPGSLRPRRRSLATPGALITIPDNDVPVDFGKDDDATLRKMIQKQNKRRGSCPINPQVRCYKILGGREWFHKNMSRGS